ncbi:aldolase-type tim barrel [Lucifera butyrica]|uniref:Aldolase-type tim barrel n=1 Tax=Lucifera butyrica TaxID=1351585 RepID=A0A498R8T2_9FIRM|nr:MupG family TIM beta-alpha barrel fold protein [Lucifera butyrica]VBB09106.1 aldolase-type tim barrel [Lucifera butyrica]
MAWEKGISAFAGMEHSAKNNCDYLELARRYGFNRLFTSLHIPEANAQTLLTEFHHLVNTATELGYSITADISPKALAQLGASPTDFSQLKRLGIHTIRLDYGFSPDQIAAITQAGDLEVEINASTITPVLLQQIVQSGTDLTRLRACHNYYPRPETGLSWSLFTERSQLLSNHGIPVFAFIPSRHTPRGPIFAGLPTLEKHRSQSPMQAAKELLACRLLAGLLFGDPLAPSQELAAVAGLDSECIELHIHVAPDITAAERELLFSGCHTNRTDPGEYAIRSQEARSRCTSAIPIPARTAAPRLPGTVTVDNQHYLRYMGELQIIHSALPADDRVNTVAHIVPEELFLLAYIRPGDQFRFKEATV